MKRSFGFTQFPVFSRISNKKICHVVKSGSEAAMGKEFLSNFSQRCWSEVCKKVKDAVVFMDTPAAECLHWYGGLLKLMDSGATDVREFTAFEKGNSDQYKAVFILTTCVQGPVLLSIRAVVKSSCFKHCVIITAASSAVHHWAKYGGREGDGSLVFHTLENQLLQWMGNTNYVAEVVHYPLFVTSVGSQLFVTPPFANLYPPTEADLERIATLQRGKQKISERRPLESLADVEFSYFPVELQTHICQFVSGFNQLLGALNAREDILTLGDFSRIVGSELECLSAAKTRRKTATNKVTVLFVDRTLDLVTPTSHSADTLMDRIQALLPRLPGHTNDVGVDMLILSSRKTDGIESNNVVAPGCLSHPENPTSWALLDAIITQKQTEALLEINKQLVKVAARRDKSAVKARRVSADSLEQLVASFAGSLEDIESHCGLLELALAAVQTLKQPGKTKMDQLLGMEKVLLQNLAVGEGQSVLMQMVQLVQSRQERGLILEDILVLLLHTYALVGQDIRLNQNEEQRLKGALAEALVKDSMRLSEDVRHIIGSSIDEMTAHRAVEKLFVKLDSIRHSRKSLKKYKSIFFHGESSQPATSTGILEQLMTDVLDPNRPELVDVECRSTGLKDLLKTGFSLFLNVSRPHPLDNPILILFVIGGITAREVHRIQEMVAASSTQVVLGSTRILNPNDALRHSFLLDPLHEMR